MDLGLGISRNFSIASPGQLAPEARQAFHEWLSWQDPDDGPARRPQAVQGADAVSLGRIHGELHYLWSAVDQDGHVLEILVQSRRIAKAAIWTLLVPAPPA